VTRVTVVDTDTLLEDVLAEARANPGQPLARMVLRLDEALRRGDPWPTDWAGRRIDDVPVADDGTGPI
jgi:CBS domain-containing protein